jgi:predicted DNA-binding protein with PD1-like motif
MAHTLQQVNTRAIRVFMGTLTDGETLHTALAGIASAENIHAATFDLLGGLTEVTLGEYDFLTHTRREPRHFRRSLEILSGHGTISRLDGVPHVHTHLTLSFRDESAPHGIALIGGHAIHAVAFAVEFTLTAYDGVPVNRLLHPGTGLPLWHLTQRG